MWRGPSPKTDTKWILDDTEQKLRRLRTKSDREKNGGTSQVSQNELNRDETLFCRSVSVLSHHAAGRSVPREKTGKKRRSDGRDLSCMLFLGFSDVEIKHISASCKATWDTFGLETLVSSNITDDMTKGWKEFNSQRKKPPTKSPRTPQNLREKQAGDMPETIGHTAEELGSFSGEKGDITRRPDLTPFCFFFSGSLICMGFVVRKQRCHRLNGWFVNNRQQDRIEKQRPCPILTPTVPPSLLSRLTVMSR